MAEYRLWPGWEIVGDPIGSGGFSTVYKIKKSSSAGEIYSALKVITIPQSPEEYRLYRDDGYDDQSITSMLRGQVDDVASEIALMSQFRGHSNIVTYEEHEIVEHSDGKGWDILIRMELLRSLPEYLQNTSVSDKDVIRIGIDICNALEICEEKKTIHRDIKPQNIFISNFGSFKLGDFGISRTMEQTTRATKVGTYQYMAPEVYNNRPYNHSADIYSLGLVLYWLLNERRMPFLPLPPQFPTAAKNSEALARRMGGEVVPAPKNGSAALRSVVLKALRFEPSERFSSASEMKEALQTAAGRTRVPAGENSNANPIPQIVPSNVSGTDATITPGSDEDIFSEMTTRTVFANPHIANRDGQNRKAEQVQENNYSGWENPPEGKKSSMYKWITIGAGVVIAAALLYFATHIGGSRAEPYEREHSYDANTDSSDIDDEKSEGGSGFGFGFGATAEDTSASDEDNSSDDEENTGTATSARQIPDCRDLADGAAKPSEDYVITLIVDMSDDYYAAAVVEGAYQAGAEYGVEVYMVDVDTSSDPAYMIREVENSIVLGYDGLIIYQALSGIAEPSKFALETGMMVVFCDCDAGDLETVNDYGFNQGVVAINSADTDQAAYDQGYYSVVAILQMLAGKDLKTEYYSYGD